MFVGVIQARFRIRGARSLKEKRRVIKSLKERVAHRFNVSIAEVDDLDVHQVATLGLAVVGGEKSFVDRSVDEVLRYISRDPEAELIDSKIEVL